jgi:hypothetical protein
MMLSMMNRDELSVIATYAVETKPTAQLHPWIDEAKLVAHNLSTNLGAIAYLKANPGRIMWLPLMKNPNAEELFDYDHIKNNSWCDFAENPAGVHMHIYHQNKINWWPFCKNTHPLAIELLEKNPEKINWTYLSANPAAIDLIKKHVDTLVDFRTLSKNPHPEAVEILTAHSFRPQIDWEAVSGNPSAIQLLKKHIEKISWEALSGNPNGIELLEQYPDKIWWEKLSANPNAMDLITKYQENIVWKYLCRNPNAMELILAHQDKISWEDLSANPSAVEFLQQHPDKIRWKQFSSNPGIFVKENETLVQNHWVEATLNQQHQ